MLDVERDGPILRLTLARPEVKNAFNEELIAALAAAFDGVEFPAVRAVVLAGKGGAFCAGGDLAWMRRMAEQSRAENVADALKLANLYQAVADCPAPVLAAVRGPAFGGGCGLVAACDVAVAAPDAKFAFSEVKLGLVPATISPFVLRKIGPGPARALFVTGEPFGADAALRIGLVQEVSEQVESVIDKKLGHILSAGPEAVRRSKALAQGAPLEALVSAELLADVRAGDEAREGTAAFLEKRPAAFVVKRP